jgi:ribosomal-protein-serine acetyltransferase
MHLPATLSVDDTIHLAMLDPDDDAPAFAACVHAAGTSTTRWLPHLLSVHDPASASTYLAERARWFTDDVSAEWGVLVAGELVGMAWLVDIQQHNNCADIGYWLVPEARGRGVATRLTRRVLDLAFDDLRLHRISIRCIADNSASRAIPERLGLMHEGTIREAWKVHDVQVDHAIYGVLAREWQQLRTRSDAVAT